MKTLLLICISTILLMFIATGCYEVVYTAEWKGDSCIKFEDALYWDEELLPEPGYVEACLGEDGVEEADEFLVELDGSTDEVEVSVKAGKCKDTVTLVWDDVEEVWWAEACGFIIAGLPEGDVWDLGVISDTDNKTAALSNVTFCFGDGVAVINPPEGPYDLERASEYEEPTEPEEEEEEIDID